jgi:hypothetical protein
LAPLAFLVFFLLAQERYQWDPFLPTLRSFNLACRIEEDDYEEAKTNKAVVGLGMTVMAIICAREALAILMCSFVCCMKDVTCSLKWSVRKKNN